MKKGAEIDFPFRLSDPSLLEGLLVPVVPHYPALLDLPLFPMVLEFPGDHAFQGFPVFPDGPVFLSVLHGITPDL